MSKKLLASEAARLLQARRKRRAGGRPKVLTPCPWCAKGFGVAELRGHLPRCPKKRAKRERS